MRLVGQTTLYFGLLVFATPAVAQELPPPDSLYVTTRCALNDGVTFEDAVEEARSQHQQLGDGGPNSVFYRQPIAGRNAAPNQFIRVVRWDNMEHWASPGNPPTNNTHTCDNSNRWFSTNRTVGTNQTAYSKSRDRSSLVSSRRCTLNAGTTIGDAYRFLSRIQAAREAQDDTSTMHLAHRFIGPSNGTETRTRIVIRLIGESADGLARTFDAQMAGDVGIGTPASAPVQHCEDPILTRSYIIHGLDGVGSSQ